MSIFSPNVVREKPLVFAVCGDTLGSSKHNYQDDDKGDDCTSNYNQHNTNTDYHHDHHDAAAEDNDDDSTGPYYDRDTQAR